MKVWRVLFRDYYDNVICEFLEFGWFFGYLFFIFFVFDLCIYCGVLNFFVVVVDYFYGEILFGCVVGLFVELFFKDVFVVFFFNIVLKCDFIEWCVIVDLSWFSGLFVNNGIFSDFFFGELFDLMYLIIDVIVDVIVFFGCGCLFYKCDFCKVYC